MKLMAVVSYTFSLIFWSSSTWSLENSIFSNDEVDNNEVDELIDLIIKKLNPTAITVKCDEINSLDGDMPNKTDEILVKSKPIKNLSKAKNLQKPDVWNNLPS